MFPQDRRVNDSLAKIVEAGIRIADHEEMGLALEYMLVLGVPSAVAFRVLAAPNSHRPPMPDNEAGL